MDWTNVLPARAENSCQASSLDFLMAVHRRKSPSHLKTCWCVWVLLGGFLNPTSAIEASADPVKDEPPITPAAREFWAFKPLLRPTPPSILNPKLARNEIDLFFQANLETSGTALAPQARPETLIRRVTFDLTGLPPSPEEVREFTAAIQTYEAASGARGPDPYTLLVDRLLASPRYGEKSAQAWLDLARFAETDGFEHDAERKLAWKYRDWVIDSLNRDLSLNEFVARQIAGDEISPEQAAATGFLLAGPDMPDTNFQTERRHLLLNDITSTVGTVFLGLTVGCAQCHNHPFDPVSQADFYRLRAFFDNLPPLKKDQQLPAAMAEASNAPAVSVVSIRGDYQRPGPKVEPAFPRIADDSDSSLAFASLPNSSGRRMALARWLTRPDNRLFLRATANRLWQFHFGEALAATPNDLGHQGAVPTNPALLDWLATEIPARNWSLKAIHKLILTSATYRQAGNNENRPTSHHTEFARRRLSGEELRDAMLQVAGRLEFRGGGPSTRLPLPSDLAKSNTNKSKTKDQPPLTPNCRSVWIFTKRNEHQPLFDLFDRPDGLLSCSRRNETTTAPQALTLFNSEFSHGIARDLAARLLQTTADPTELVPAAPWQCFSRAPTAMEETLGLKFLNEHGRLTSDPTETLADYCLALLNSNAFCFVD